MKKVSAYNAVVEVGRLCTDKCKHCLRGPMEKVTINVECVKDFLRQFSSISCITFTGGEPTLYAKQIAEIIDFIIESEIEVYSFYIASNGKKYSPKLMKALDRFYEYLDQYGDNECTAYDVSNDQFHNPDPAVVDRLERHVYFHQRTKIPQAGIISEGYAEENGIGRRVLDHSKKFYVTANEYRDTTEYEVEMIYLNALGYLYPDCDYSYATQRSIPTKHCKEVSIIDFITNEEYADINW